ncbi:ankyrin repeat protein [Histoplasma capsulatum G186AR]|uniref:Ankyrin repeat protein n=1 Tax=Ajellomyces capsulatus TaxID=5037 RepID=A0A8H7YM04_AJECA|nr:ankyrin repeat protein [Histoplasma capsulatum]QSS75128.1 ankyrin repeat protein [Histoplasma capsulatum G186AR]
MLSRGNRTLACCLAQPYRPCQIFTRAMVPILDSLPTDGRTTNCHETGKFGACAIFSGNWRHRYEHPCMWKVRTHSPFSGQLGLVTSKS